MNYDIIKPLFMGSFSERQLNGLNTIVEEAGDIDDRHLAYILATIFHETGRKMQPVTEYGGEAYLKAKLYYPFYGRDLVQTTWRVNYEKVKEFSRIDVISNPELIGQMPLAARVAIKFMQQGWYTGKKLSDFFNNEISNPVGARRIINGMDKAELIAGYYELFLEAGKKGGVRPPKPH